jgi:MoxR-like ATPase
VEDQNRNEDAMSELSTDEAMKTISVLRERIGASIFGQDDLITETLSCFLAGGHILMTGAPGLAKTTLVRVFSKNLGLNFGRIQFTPDLLPSDITGTDILNIDPASQRRNFEFSKGPIFVNLLLADEINRASPRTQSAMLEAMQERTVTNSGKVHHLPNPFMVFATQNPFESEGTFPLPEAQLDRFLLHTLVAYPSKDAENRILTSHTQDDLVGEQHYEKDHRSDTVLTFEVIRSLMKSATMIRVDPEIVGGINELVRSTRPSDDTCPDDLKKIIWYGAGPRAGISFISVCRALALIEGSTSVRWRHVRRMAAPVLRHRLRLTAQASHERLEEDHVIKLLLDRLEEHRTNLAKGLD